jgi:hypothetical protein
MARIVRSVVTLSLFPVGAAFRVRLPLPAAGECWFTVDSQQDVQSFLEEVKLEDKSIQSVQTEHPFKLFREAAEEGIMININNTAFVLRKTATAEVIESKSLMASFVENLQKANVKDKNEMNQFVDGALADLGEQFGTYLSVLRNTVSEIDAQISAIRKKEEEILKKIRFKSKMYCGGILGLLAAQWGFFYYTIYEVDWLGWDLMEPITFTVGQSSFVLSLYYYLKTQTPQTYGTMMLHDAKARSRPFPNKILRRRKKPNSFPNRRNRKKISLIITINNHLIDSNESRSLSVIKQFSTSSASKFSFPESENGLSAEVSTRKGFISDLNE